MTIQRLNGQRVTGSANPEHSNADGASPGDQGATQDAPSRGRAAQQAQARPPRPLRSPEPRADLRQVVPLTPPPPALTRLTVPDAPRRQQPVISFAGRERALPMLPLRNGALRGAMFDFGEFNLPGVEEGGRASPAALPERNSAFQAEGRFHYPPVFLTGDIVVDWDARDRNVHDRNADANAELDSVDLSLSSDDDASNTQQAVFNQGMAWLREDIMAARLPLLRSDPTIRDFLKDNQLTPMGAFIAMISDFVRDRPSQSVWENLRDRVHELLAFYGAHPTVQDGMQNIADVSSRNCRDGALGGLLEMEKFMGEHQLTAKVRDGKLSKSELYDAAKQYYALNRVEAMALTLCTALGSTHETIEVALLLIKDLGRRLDLPVKNLSMQHQRFALNQFQRGFDAYYAGLSVGEVVPNDAESTVPTQSNERLDYITQRIKDALDNKVDVIDFMASWAPAQAFVDQHAQSSLNREAQTDQNGLDAIFEYVEMINTVSAKSSLTVEDRESLIAVFHFLMSHSNELPESLNSALVEGRKSVTELSSIPQSLAVDCLEALQLVHANIGRAPYQRALSALYAE